MSDKRVIVHRKLHVAGNPRPVSPNEQRIHLKQCRLELEELGDELLGRIDHRLSYRTCDAADEPARGVDCGAKREGRVGSEQSALPGLRFDVDATLRRNKQVQPRAHGIQRETQITFRPLDYFFNPTGANGMALYRRSE